MTAIAVGTVIDQKGSAARTWSRPCYTILKGQKIPRGALAMVHNGRAMNAGPLDITKSVADGGPLKATGADDNGHVYFWSLFGQGVSVSLANAVALSISVDVANVVAIKGPVASLTAAEVVQAVQAHARASQLLECMYSGTGAGLFAAMAPTAVPHVELLGVAMFDLDNSSDAVNDNTIPPGQAEFRYGKMYLLNDTGNPVTATGVPGMGYVLDNVTITAIRTAYCLPVRIDDFGAYGKTAGMVCVDLK